MEETDGFNPVFHIISPQKQYSVRIFFFSSREIQLLEAGPGLRSNVYALDGRCGISNIGYKFGGKGILPTRRPPNARKIVIFTFSIEHPFFWPNSKANKTIYNIYIVYTHTHDISRPHTRGNNYEQKSPPNPMGSGRHSKLFGRDIIDYIYSIYHLLQRIVRVQPIRLVL